MPSSTVGDNQVTVGVDSERGADDVPPPVTDWEDYGGITREVVLVLVPETYVDDAWVRLTGDGRCRVVPSRRHDQAPCPRCARTRSNCRGDVVGTGVAAPIDSAASAVRTDADAGRAPQLHAGH